MGTEISTNGKWALGGLFALSALGAVGLYYLKTGVGRDRNAALIPDAIEDRIDAVVEALNHHFGPAWVQAGVKQLEAGLRNVVPPPLVALVDVVYEVERFGRQRRWSGSEKRARAAQAA